MSTETKKASAVVVVGHHKINADGSREGTIISSYRWPEIVEEAGLTGQWMELVLVPAGEAQRDWSLLEATQESLREHSQMLRERDARIAELEAQVRTAAPAELVELLDRLSPPGHGIALKGDPTQTFHTGHDVYLAQRVRAWLATHESRLRGEGE